MKWGEHWPEQVRPVQPPAAGDGRRADQSRSLDVVSPGDRRRALPDRRYLVADRDRRDHDRPPPRRDPDGPGSATRPLPGIVPRSSPRTASPSARIGHGGFLVIKQPWPSMLRTLYGDDERYQGRPTGARFPAATSPATGPAETRTATTGSWGGSTTSSTSPGIASRRWKSKAPWSAIPRWPRRRSSASPTRCEGRRSPRS